MKTLIAPLLLLLIILPAAAQQYDGYLSTGLYHTLGSTDKLETEELAGVDAPVLRLFESASLRLRFSPQLQLKSRGRYALGTSTGDDLNSFALLQASLRWQSIDSGWRVEAGRLSLFQLALPLKLDGIDLKRQLGQRYSLRLTGGYKVPLPGDFSYESEDLLVSARFSGRQYGFGYSLLGIWDAAEYSANMSGLELIPPTFQGIRLRGLYLYNLTDQRLGDCNLYLARSFNQNLLLSARYRLTSPTMVVVPGAMEILPAMHDALRLSLLYRATNDWRLQASQLTTITSEQEWFNTRLTVGWRWLDVGALFTTGPDINRWQATAALAHRFGSGLRLSGGFNMLEYDSTSDFASEEEGTSRASELVFGSRLGIDWNWRQLHLGWNVYHTRNAAWENSLRGAMTLRYNFGGQL